MAAIPSDYTIVGTVLAVAVAILLLSGLALYISFRVRETVHDGKGRSSRKAKVAAVVVLLMVAGFAYYFFIGFGPAGTSNSQTTSQSTSVSTSASSSTASTSTSAVNGPITMQLAYPTTMGVSQGFYVTFSLYNSGSLAVSGASIDLGNLALTFAVVNASTCNPQCTTTTWSGGVVSVGTLNPGSTVVKVGLKAPSSPTQFSGQSTLYYQGEASPLSVSITIRVSGRA